MDLSILDISYKCIYGKNMGFWFHFFHLMFLRPIPIVAWSVRVPFSRLNSIPLWDNSLFIQSSVAGHMDCSYLLTTVNSAVLNMCAHMFVWVFSSLGYVARSGTVGSLPISLCPATFIFASNKRNITLVPKCWQLNGGSSLCPNCSLIYVTFPLRASSLDLWR